MSESKRAERIRLAIEATRDKSGRVTAKGVVAAARDKKNPLHREFGKLWDAKYAQQKALEVRAQELITYVTLTITTSSRVIETVMYVKDPRIPPNEQGHVPLTSSVLNRQHAEQVVLAELDRCESAITRARDICDVLDLKHPGMSAHLQGLLENTIALRTAVLQAAE